MQRTTIPGLRLLPLLGIAALVAACGDDTTDVASSSASEATAAMTEGTSDGTSAGSADTTATTPVTSLESGSTTADAPIDVSCVDPQPGTQSDGATPSGFESCGDGFVHRATAETCVVPDAGDCDECPTDCGVESPLGRCMTELGGGGCSCVESCETDADCGDGFACVCTGPIGGVPRCVPAGCATSDDCDGGLCGLSGSNGCEFDQELACLTPDSECRSTTCQDGLPECVCYADAGEYRCHDECFSGCG